MHANNLNDIVFPAFGKDEGMRHRLPCLLTEVSERSSATSLDLATHCLQDRQRPYSWKLPRNKHYCNYASMTLSSSFQEKQLGIFCLELLLGSLSL